MKARVCYDDGEVLVLRRQERQEFLFTGTVITISDLIPKEGKNGKKAALRK